MTTEPLTLAEAKEHLRIEDDDPYLTYLAGYITAARQAAEEYINGSIANQPRTYQIDAFPSGQSVVIRLPAGPVVSVTSIIYVDADGVSQTLDAADYMLVSHMLAPAFGTVWPDTRAQLGAVTIAYTAGMMSGSPLTLERADIKAAIRLILGDIWENREGQIVGVPISVNPTVERLLNPHRRDLGV